MNTLQLFQSKMFGAIRATIIDSDPWFVGADVAKALDYADAKKAVYDHVDAEDKQLVNGASFSLTNAPETPISNRDLTIINESGVYSLIFQSKQERAKEFKRWVTHDVLPTLRKTGQYSMGKHDFKLTKMDYFKAMRIVSSARLERLPYLIESFRRIGIDLPDVSQEMMQALSDGQDKTFWKRKADAPITVDGFRQTDDELANLLRKAYKMEISFGLLSQKSGVGRSSIYKYMWGTQKPGTPEKRQALTDAANELIGVVEHSMS